AKWLTRIECVDSFSSVDMQDTMAIAPDGCERWHPEGGFCEKVFKVGSLRPLRAFDDRSHHHDQPLCLLLVLCLCPHSARAASMAGDGVDGSVLPAALGYYQERDSGIPALASGNVLLQPGHPGLPILCLPSLQRQALPQRSG